jgi:TonB family protein
MQYHLPPEWEDTGLISLFRSPFLFPSIILHACFMLFVMRAVSLNLNKPAQDPPITVQLTEFRDGGSINRSIGASRGPGGPRTPPKQGVTVSPAPRTGKVDTGATESSMPSSNEEPTAPAPKPVALPGPKVLATNTRSDQVNVNESAPDSLVRLPTKAAPTTLPGAPAEAVQHNSLAAGKGTADGPGVKALTEGTQIPGALKGTGTGTGAYGVPGGSKSGTGLAGGGTGVGSGGGSATGLKGSASSDYSQYFNQLKKRVQSVWKYPDGIAGIQKVHILFSLDKAGNLVQAEVLESSDARLNASAVEAMRRASPFPPIPESLKDLANSPLRMEFTVEIRVRG